jgi:hypothetical protein
LFSAQINPGEGTTMTTFTGRWFTSFGPMELTQEVDAVHGTYWNQGVACTLEGHVEEDCLVFRYREPAEAGAGWFAQPRFGRFAGRWHVDGQEAWHDWQGHRTWDGVWETSFGRLRLVQEPDRVVGFYDGAGPSRIDGRVEEGRLVFRYEEPQARGEGCFEAAEDGQSFAGEWRSETMAAWAAWTGRRVRAVPGRTWLMVIEAHWQRSVAEGEYSFGGMLREFFARLPEIAVRQRFFNDEVSLQRWCRELLYFPEPAVVMIASHGSPQGVHVFGRTIDTKRVIDSLRHADNIRLLHFSSCAVLHEENAGDFARRVERAVPFAVSGYTTSVDWGGSAIIEFTYLDLILAKGLPPEQAAALVPRLIAYAGDQEVPGSPYAAAGFGFYGPSRAGSAAE